MIHGEEFNYIHIMKTGGTYLRRASEKLPPGIIKKYSTHTPYKELSRKRAELPTYAMIRNPWDWYVSWYHYQLKDRKNAVRYYKGPFKDRSKTYQEIDLLYRRSFTDVLLSTDDISKHRRELHTHFLNMTQREDGLHENIRWLRFENGVRPEFFRMIEEVRGPLKPLEKNLVRTVEKKNVSNHTHYRDYYTPETRQWVAEKEKHIIETFGYEF